MNAGRCAVLEGQTRGGDSVCAGQIRMRNAQEETDHEPAQ